MPTVVFLVLSFPFYYCYRDCREIITETACTSTRLWHPIMPRGAPRGHGIFYQSAERSGKTASVFCSFFFFFPTVKRSSTSLASLRRVIISDKSNCIPSRRSSSRSTRRLRVTTLPSLPGEKNSNYIPFPMIIRSFHFYVYTCQRRVALFLYRLNVMDSVSERF